MSDEPRVSFGKDELDEHDTDIFFWEPDLNVFSVYTGKEKIVLRGETIPYRASKDNSFLACGACRSYKPINSKSRSDKAIK